MATAKAKYGNDYPWDVWLIPGRTVRLRRGTHYSFRTDTFALQIRRAARKRGLVVRIVTDKSGDGLTVTVEEGAK